MRAVSVLALCLLLVAGCGDEAPPAATQHAGPPSDAAPPTEPDPAPAAAEPATKAGSAFRLARALDQVKHDLDLDLVRNGIRDNEPRDAIPAILEPRFVKAEDVTFMRPERRVITVRIGAAIRAYPIHILDQHELVNDVVGGTPILVTWCPLCGSAVVYPRTIDGEVRTFGVSGYLYKSDVLMYDHQTESFWSQLALQAVVGPSTGTALDVLPSQIMKFGDYRKRHPGALVLSDDQGIVEPHQYVRQVYLGYDKTPRVFFPVGPQSGALFSKAEVIGVVVNGRARAYALAALRMLGEESWLDTVGGQQVTLRHDAAGDTVTVHDSGGRLLAHQRMFWFAWYAFHPDTDLRATRTGELVVAPGDVPLPKKKPATKR